MGFSLQRITRPWNPNDDMPDGQEFLMDDAAYWKEWLLRRRYAKEASQRAEARRRYRRIGLCVFGVTTVAVVVGVAQQVLHFIH